MQVISLKYKNKKYYLYTVYIYIYIYLQDIYTFLYFRNTTITFSFRFRIVKLLKCLPVIVRELKKVPQFLAFPELRFIGNERRSKGDYINRFEKSYSQVMQITTIQIGNSLSTQNNLTSYIFLLVKNLLSKYS